MKLDYKKGIMNMIQEMQNESYLRDIFCFIEVPYNMEKKKKAEKEMEVRRTFKEYEK